MKFTSKIAVAAVAGARVAVVALLPADLIEHAVSADPLALTVRRAAVAWDRIPVVALLRAFQLAVSAFHEHATRSIAIA